MRNAGGPDMMVGVKSPRPQRREDFLLLFLSGLVLIQLAFVLGGGPERVVPLARQEDQLALQGRDPSVPQQGTDPGPGGQAGKARAITSSPEPAVYNQPDSLAGGPMAGNIPVALGEGAPVNLPPRAGRPERPELLEQPGGSSPFEDPGELEEGEPYAGLEEGESGRSELGQGGQGSPPPVRFRRPRRSGGRSSDPYRQLLMAIYRLEEKGGAVALTEAQARHLLALVRDMEGMKDAVPDTQKALLATLSSEQLSFIRAQRAAQGARARVGPEQLDRLAREAFRSLGGRP